MTTRCSRQIVNHVGFLLRASTRSWSSLAARSCWWKSDGIQNAHKSDLAFYRHLADAVLESWLMLHSMNVADFINKILLARILQDTCWIMMEDFYWEQRPAWQLRPPINGWLPAICGSVAEKDKFEFAKNLYIMLVAKQSNLIKEFGLLTGTLSNQAVLFALQNSWFTKTNDHHQPQQDGILR